MSEAKIRLYVDQALAAGQPVALGADQAHYLFGVMRLGVGAVVALFNGRDGEWRAVVAEVGKRGGVLVCAAQVRDLVLPPDLWLLFAPIKKARTDFIVEKAVEMGVSRIIPVQTQHTNSERIRQDRLQAHAVEAAEQCGATVVPEVADLVGLDRLLSGWPDHRRLMWCDEAMARQAGAGHAVAAEVSAEQVMAGQAAAGPAVAAEGSAEQVMAEQALAGQVAVLPGGRGAAWAILIGPEGGFSDREAVRLRGMAAVVPVSLGPRILRADTAAVAALTLWQMQLGDWA